MRRLRASSQTRLPESVNPVNKNVAPLIFEDDEGHRRPIGFVELGPDGYVNGRFNIISSKHRDLSPGIFRALTQQYEGEHSNGDKEAKAGTRSR